MSELSDLLYKAVMAEVFSDSSNPHIQKRVQEGLQARDALVRIIQEDDQAVEELTNLILDDWYHTPIPEVEAKISVFSHIDSEQASPQILEKLYYIANTREEPDVTDEEFLSQDPIYREDLFPDPTTTGGSFVTIAAVKGLVHFANSSNTRTQANQYILQLLQGDNSDLQHKVLQGLWELKIPTQEILHRVLQLTTVKQPWPGEYLVRGRAIEVLGKWGIVTPEVVEAVKHAFDEAIADRVTLLYEYAEIACQKLGIR